MRFLKMFFLLLVALLLIVGIGYVLIVETTVRYGVWEFRKEIEVITMFAANQNNEHIRLCTESVSQSPVDERSRAPLKPGAADYPLSGYQLRFTSPTTFLIEVICQKKPAKVIGISEGKLTRGLVKVQGSGILAPIRFPNTEYTATGKVVVRFGYRSMVVGLIDGSIASNALAANEPIDEGTSIPKTTCEGWGNFCCPEALEVGEGSAEPRATDCPNICFSHCGQRPVLVFFNSDPLLDFRSRTLTLYGKTVDVSFGYEITDADSAISSVVIDYGDGTTYNSTLENGITSHTYSCDQAQCTYKAAITATDVKGYTLGFSRNAEITVIVNGGSLTQ